MTQAIFSLLYARLGNGDKAYHFLKDAYIPNLNPPFRVIAEPKVAQTLILQQVQVEYFKVC